MRTYKTFFALMVVAVSVAISGCGSASVEEPATILAPAKAETEAKVEMVSDHGFGYIPLYINGPAAAHAQEILSALQKFESEHQDLRITSWSVERNQSGYAMSPFVQGIWISYAKVSK